MKMHRPASPIRCHSPRLSFRSLPRARHCSPPTHHSHRRSHSPHHRSHSPIHRSHSPHRIHVKMKGICKLLLICIEITQKRNSFFQLQLKIKFLIFSTFFLHFF